MESNTSKQYEAYRPSMSKLPISLNTSIKPVHIATYASPLKLFSPSGYVQIPDPPHLERVREKDAVRTAAGVAAIDAIIVILLMQSNRD